MSESASDIFAGHFTDRKVLVTGAARGMGFTIARSFAEAGAAVLLLDRSDHVREAAESLLAAGLDARGRVVDVTDESQVAAAVAAAGEEWGVIDVVINNAGVISVEYLQDLTTAEFQRILNVNTVAPFVVARECAPWVRKSAHGVILNAASAQAREGFIYTPHYAASKFGVMGLTQSLAKELAADNVRVNAYCPGIVKTDMWGYLDGAWAAKLGDYQPGELVDEWIADIPLKRPATEADVANLLLFLASDAATYITGQTVNIDGGMSMN
ncbi:SDR family oxidoreductase [Microbacterium lushaniae]|nr:SDR family oxidoreductase [Microbacterium lushaniae]KAA9155236.1 SDR family oxidoreductase [Microbacterium lushaniae]